MDLRNLDGMTRRTLGIGDGKRSRTRRRMRNVVDMVRAVEVLSIPADGENHR